ncbi:MAG: hypothetical protein EAZ95_12640 [Bacteroidetes bacterium]|nr:MAG: hypothetical protein EAZ95_12640 [Bacteroidota bacterium]
MRTETIPFIGDIPSAFGFSHNDMSVLEAEIAFFVQSLARLLEGAYRLKSNALHYALVLKDDTIENRQAFFNFSDEYEEQGGHFELRFYFVRQDLVPRLNIEKTIEF